VGQAALQQSIVFVFLFPVFAAARRRFVFANAAEGGVGEFRSVCNLPPPEAIRAKFPKEILPHQSFSKKVLAVFSIFHQIKLPHAGGFFIYLYN